mmetsp:Transcript_27451/g.12789  ORF Transcript_27451/g.12789 Transcript_27451/m.12789 type:complete len:88 (-) Transcript_27451:47-310(-)
MIFNRVMDSMRPERNRLPEFLDSMFSLLFNIIRPQIIYQSELNSVIRNPNQKAIVNPLQILEKLDIFINRLFENIEHLLLFNDFSNL